MVFYEVCYRYNQTIIVLNIACIITSHLHKICLVLQNKNIIINAYEKRERSRFSRLAWARVRLPYNNIVVIMNGFIFVKYYHVMNFRTVQNIILKKSLAVNVNVDIIIHIMIKYYNVLENLWQSSFSSVYKN